MRIDRANVAALVLVALTVVSYALIETGFPTLAASAGVAAIALVKVNLVITEFMHLHWVHRPFRQFAAIWTAIVASILGAGLYALPW